MSKLIETGVHVWSSYWGVLLTDGDPKNRSILYGFENIKPNNCHQKQAVIPDNGSCFGFVESGCIHVLDKNISWQLAAGQWFTLPEGFELNLTGKSRVMVAQSVGYKGVYAMGGPIETCGRLRYIDGCSDTLLSAPLLLGDPCLNHLHFPAAILQTAHTHPSTRAGIIAGGEGICIAAGKAIALASGVLFYIARNTEHCFKTEKKTLDVIAFHPDSDWGPTHQDHPMVNRTFVNGHKIDNTDIQHSAAVINGH